ncbi:MAG: homoserine dehydrogenase, partial [Bacteroidia bacterium]|nr:homoserine dehydrogenase [Bacteroidia bacterium]
LKKGKSVVTANKKLIAEHFNELLELQKKHGAALLYEAACCASIPIIRNLEEYYDNDLLESIEGIVNGSTNYILSKTEEEKISYQEALKQAQEKGYAESNPILDTGGFDAKFKLLILIAHAFGKVLKPSEIFNLGIDSLGEFELNYAREKGYKIKLVAQALKDEAGQISAFVFPKFVEKSDKLFSVDDVFNGIKTKSCFSDVQFFSGKGAGAHPTASAVISDLSALSYDYRYEYKKLSDKAELKNKNDIFLKVLFRHNAAESSAFKKYFVSIEESFQAKEGGYLVGLISLEQIERIRLRNNPSYSFVLFGIAEGFTAKDHPREPDIEFRELFMD